VGALNSRSVSMSCVSNSAADQADMDRNYCYSFLLLRLCPSAILLDKLIDERFI